MDTLSLELRDRVLWIRLDRPDQLNAFTPAMADELEIAFDDASGNDDVGVVIVTGSGRAFCAGMDLTKDGNVFGLDETMQPRHDDFADRFDEPDFISGVRDTGGRVTLAIHRCRKPILAAINGSAVGVGATMTLAMDFRMMSTKARMGFVFGKLGIVPEACSTWFLPRLVGLEKALEWCLTAELIDADAALAGGLVRSIHEPDALLAEAEAFARKLITDRSPTAIALTKHMLRRNAAGADPAAAHAIESLAMFYTSQKDGREGVKAFVEKRAPQFTEQASALPQFAEAWLADG